MNCPRCHNECLALYKGANSLELFACVPCRIGFVHTDTEEHMDKWQGISLASMYQQLILYRNCLSVAIAEVEELMRNKINADPSTE